ncbi:MAG: replication factor [Archaeoglobaceae archaeon]|nr:replication factor [Archaeoglobaceae archaeon]MDK2875828.1 replication factor [Archaeoglobaceae archaeon]
MIEELLTLIEKNRTQLTKLDESIYEKIRKRIEELEEKKEDDERTEDEIKTLKRLQRKLFELRTGKIINAAWAEVCGQEVGFSEENMSPLEREFFKTLVDKIREFQMKVFEAKKERVERMLVRIKKDVEILGVDGKRYKLRKEDVATLPAENAEVLVKSGIAERIEVK